MPLFNLYKKLTEDPKKVLEDKIKKQEDRIDLFSNSLKETIERERESSRHMMEKNPKYWENSFAHIIEARTEKIKIKYFILAEKFRYETEKKLNITEDWANYLKKADMSIDNVEHPEAQGQEATKEDIEEWKENNERLYVEINEIEDRFDKLLKD